MMVCGARQRRRTMLSPDPEDGSPAGLGSKGPTPGIMNRALYALKLYHSSWFPGVTSERPKKKGGVVKGGAR